jgi:hypothetical protein
MMPPPPPVVAAPSVVTSKADSGVNISVELKGATKVVLLKVSGLFMKNEFLIILFVEYGWAG